MNRIQYTKNQFAVFLIVAGLGLITLTIGIRLSNHSLPNIIKPTEKPPLTPEEFHTRQLILKINDLSPNYATLNTSVTNSIANKYKFFQKYHTIPSNLEKILQVYYGGSELIHERRAYRRVLRWKNAVAQIIKDYDRISPEAMLAIIKEETQGKTGNQVSQQMAVGLTQIKYQGAWAFIWNALFKESVTKEGITKPDYYNHGIRKRYRKQLERIRNHLIENELLYSPPTKDPADFRRARSISWEKLKNHLNRRYKTHEYQIVVDISAMYIDHLTFQLNDLSAKVALIKQFFDEGKVKDIDLAKFNGSTQKVWLRVKRAFIADIINIYRESNRFGLKENKIQHNYKMLWFKIRKEILHRLEIDMLALLKKRLAFIVAQTNDPKTSYAAYHTGPTTIFECIENACVLPISAVRYAQNVEKHKVIFTDLATSQKLLTYKKNAFHDKPKRL